MPLKAQAATMRERTLGCHLDDRQIKLVIYETGFIHSF